MFIVYFIVDVIYQARLCPKQTTEEDVSNSLYNSLNISLWVAAGYFIATLLFPENYSDIGNRTNSLQALMGDYLTTQTDKLKTYF